MEEAVTTTSMENVLTGLDTCLDVFSSLLDLVVQHPVLATVFAGGTLVPIGIGIFHSMKRG